MAEDQALDEQVREMFERFGITEEKDRALCDALYKSQPPSSLIHVFPGPDLQSYIPIWLMAAPGMLEDAREGLHRLREMGYAVERVRKKSLPDSFRNNRIYDDIAKNFKEIYLITGAATPVYVGVTPDCVHEGI